jgi:hypothetical protein
LLKLFLILNLSHHLLQFHFLPIFLVIKSELSPWLSVTFIDPTPIYTFVPLVSSNTLNSWCMLRKVVSILLRQIYSRLRSLGLWLTRLLFLLIFELFQKFLLHFVEINILIILVDVVIIHIVRIIMLIVIVLRRVMVSRHMSTFWVESTIHLLLLLLLLGWWVFEIDILLLLLVSNIVHDLHRQIWVDWIKIAAFLFELRNNYFLSFNISVLVITEAFLSLPLIFQTLNIRFLSFATTLIFLQFVLFIL